MSITITPGHPRNCFGCLFGGEHIDGSVTPTDKETVMSFEVCSQCAPGVAYDDWSHLDYNGVSDEYRALIHSAVESMGFVSLTGPVEHLDYFRCYICDMDAIGGTTFEEIN